MSYPKAMCLQLSATTEVDDGLKTDWMVPITPISSNVQSRLACDDVYWGFTALQHASTPCTSQENRQYQSLSDSGYKSTEWHSVSELGESLQSASQTSSFLRSSASDSRLPRLEISSTDDVLSSIDADRRKDRKIICLPTNVLVEATVAKFSPKYGGYLIGRKMGEEQLDIIGNLHSLHCYSALQKIFAELELSELVKISQISVAWRDSVLTDTESRRRLNQMKKMSGDFQERLGAENRLNVVVSGLDKCHSRQLTSNKPLNLIQTLGCRLSNAASSLLNYPPASPPRTTQKQNATSPSPRKGSKHNKIADSSPRGRHDLFVSEASTLRESERLTKCSKCSCPAKVMPVTLVAICSRANCQYQFCSKCRGPPHGSQDCSLDFELFGYGSSSKETVSVQRAKKNLRRLLR